MIYINLSGRCGNQLFLYAFARKLQLQYNETIVINSSFMKNKAEMYKNEKYWEDSLCRFKLYDVDYCCEEDDMVGIFGDQTQCNLKKLWNYYYSVMQKIKFARWHLVQSLVFRFFSRFGLYFNWNGGASYYFFSKKKNKFVIGAFEDYEWFSDIRSYLLDEIVPKKDLKNSNKKLYKHICSSNSVCVSLRKWSIDVHNEKDLKNRSICDEQYYKKAIKYFEKNVENPVFVVFSDDILWARECITKIVNGRFPVIFETGEDDVDEKLCLMYSCKHFIIANSTFSWWAQYLGKDPNKIVVSPKTWFADGENRNNLIMRNFITF